MLLAVLTWWKFLVHQLLSYDVRRNPSLGMPNTVPSGDHEIEEPCPLQEEDSGNGTRLCCHSLGVNVNPLTRAFTADCGPVVAGV
jgi:hypothetical protein